MSNNDHDPGSQWHVKARHSLRTKFLLAFMLVFLATFIGAGVIGVKGLPFSDFEGWEANAKREAVWSLNLVADLRKERLMIWLRERLGDARVLAENPLLRAAVPFLFSSSSATAATDANTKSLQPQVNERQVVEQIVSLLDSVQSAYSDNRVVSYQVIRIVDARSGQVVVSTNADEIGAVLSGQTRILDGIVRSRKSYISDVAVEEHGTQAYLNVGHPVFDSKGVVIAMVVLEVTLENALSLTANNDSARGKTEETLLIDEGARILTALRHPLSDGSQAVILVHKITATPAVLAASGHEGVIESEDYRGHEVIAAYRHLRVSPDWGWGLVVKVDKAQLFASISKASRSSLWIGLVGVVLISILSLFLTRQLTAPLSRITEVATRLAAGERFVRSRVSRRDEIGVLSVAFDDMVEKQDATNRSLLRRTAELDTVNKELESFAYAVAHDLRAPLRAIDGFSQALVEDHGEQLEGEAKTYLRYLREGSQEMAGLIDDLLKLSRATRGEISFVDVNLSKMAIDILAELRLADPDRSVETNIAQGIVVSGDPRLLRVAMDNLLGNAWKFTARCPQANISFAAERMNGRLRCVIKDNGVGFDMAYKNKLFIPFQRLHRSEEFEGTGIGLVTVQRIIHRHGGTLLAEGVVDEGARFTFELDAGQKDHE